VSGIVEHCLALLKINGEELCITEEQWLELLCEMPLGPQLPSPPEGCTFLGRPIRIVPSLLQQVKK
jgi:hypothetical protein